MDYNLFINNFIENINNLNHRDFNKNNFKYVILFVNLPDNFPTPF